MGVKRQEAWVCHVCQVATALVMSYLQLSTECRSLLDRIFVADVKQRITVEGIMQHPWYLHPLPSHYQSQLQHLDQVQAQKDAHIRSRRIDPVRAAVISSSPQRNPQDGDSSPGDSSGNC